MFGSGELRLVLLALLETEPRHGYDFIRELEEKTGGAYAPSPGVVYPTLALLEDMGLIEETPSEGSKRLYAITEAGRAHLDEHRAEADAAMARIAEVGSEASRTSAGPVSRSMQNLAAVLRNRLSASQDQQTLFDVAEIIDEAARRIERL